MSQNGSPGDETLSFSVLQRIEEVCRDFEDSWKAGGRPEIESYLPRVPPLERSKLLRQLLLLELAYRRQRGEQPAAEEYCRRFPGDEQTIIAAFKQVAEADQPSAQSDLEPFAPGQRIGRYRIERELGRGNFGIVLRPRRGSNGSLRSFAWRPPCTIWAKRTTTFRE